MTMDHMLDVVVSSYQFVFFLLLFFTSGLAMLCSSTISIIQFQVTTLEV